jgi:hypothetical protein
MLGKAVANGGRAKKELRRSPGRFLTYVLDLHDVNVDGQMRSVCLNLPNREQNHSTRENRFVDFFVGHRRKEVLIHHQSLYRWQPRM